MKAKQRVAAGGGAGLGISPRPALPGPAGIRESQVGILLRWIPVAIPAGYGRVYFQANGVGRARLPAGRLLGPPVAVAGRCVGVCLVVAIDGVDRVDGGRIAIVRAAAIGQQGGRFLKQVLATGQQVTRLVDIVALAAGGGRDAKGLRVGAVVDAVLVGGAGARRQTVAAVG